MHLPTKMINDLYLTHELPSLNQEEIGKELKNVCSGFNIRFVAMFNPNGRDMTHGDVLTALDSSQFMIKGPPNSKTGLLIFLKSPTSDIGHFVVAIESNESERHYKWYDSLNLCNRVLHSHFSLPADEMFSSGLFQRGFQPLVNENCIMAEAKWSTCGYWSAVWIAMATGKKVEDSKILITPIPRASGAYTEEELGNPKTDMRPQDQVTVQKLLHTNEIMLQTYQSLFNCTLPKPSSI
jgi:hypothetical protein